MPTSKENNEKSDDEAKETLPHPAVPLKPLPEFVSLQKAFGFVVNVSILADVGVIKFPLKPPDDVLIKLTEKIEEVKSQ